MLHNRRTLPRGVSPELARVTGVVRDADKLDIMAVMLEHLRPGGPDNPVVTLHLEHDPARWTPRLARQVRARELGDYAAMRYTGDFVLLLMSWAYDMNFAASRRAMLDRELLQGLSELLPPAPELRELAVRVRRDLEAGA
jgi:hypothetical protein